MTSYQPVWRGGQAVAEGERECADRWEPIREVLAAVEQPFTVLDLGAAQGYFSARAAEEFGCRVSAIDSDRAVAQAASSLVTPYVRRVDASGLRHMARHDVVLALSVLHHFGDWRAVLRQVRACRRWAVVEVPHPGERWLRSAAARHQLAAIHDAVAAVAERRLGEFERTGRDGSRHMRPMYLLRGTVRTVEGEVFGGSGTCSRKLRPHLHAAGLDRELGYQPFPGSLNLRCKEPPVLGAPAVNWPGRVGGKSRPYWFWEAWVGKLAVHAMDPAGRGHGPDCIEVVAPVRLRDRLSLADGDTVRLDVETTEKGADHG
ncbi:DUF120 domain-containing protein [Streptomyces aidingensis]|uniref:Methyltransferase domain-containing protein n=1 Tax=Streptomyces aidingensis TaxID=910347 RepID=A0A1I1PWW9_9ACTN|nr:DUF120 domain-containing protein [Streptomyces aidingensis]SFD14329.1 Methyltransferase domain-containing protein [Streptomyces aidingensis]